MNKPVEIKEFESIICNPEYAGDGRTCVSKRDFENFISRIHNFSGDAENSDALDFMKVGYKRGIGDLVSFKNYVGLIQLKNGFQIQVLPKIDFSFGEDVGNGETKKVFLKMLRSMKDFPSKVFNEASLKVDRMNLYEIFINMYLQEARQLVKHGLRSDYIQQEDNLHYYKGKLLMSQHIKTNLVHKERFYVSFDEFQLNRPENKLIKATLEKLSGLTTSAENAREIRQLLTAFELVDSSVDYDKDFAKVVINRNTRDYENLIKWSRVFLKNKSFTTFSGDTSSKALLFPMESVYESYVSREVKKIFGPSGWDVSCQDRGQYLFDEPRKLFALRPDIVLKKNNHIIIMDAKWKRLFPNEGQNYGISQADMYQMYAYSKKYGTDDIWLLYPITKEMRGHAPVHYYSKGDTHVRLYFVDVANVENSLSELKETIELLLEGEPKLWA